MAADKTTAVLLLIACPVSILQMQVQLPVMLFAAALAVATGFRLVSFPQCSRRYSLLSAVIGSTCIARRAGAKLAIIATSKRTPETATSVAGSVGVTSKSAF